MPTSYLIRAAALVPFVEILQSAGAPLHRHLAAASLPEDIGGQPDALIAKRQFYEFLGSVAESADLPGIGLQAGEELTVHKLGAAGVAIRRAPTLREACRVFAVFIDRFVEGNRTWIEEHADGSAWIFNHTAGPEVPGRAVADHGAIPMLTSLVRLVAGEEWYPSEIQLQTERAPEAFRGTAYEGAVIRFSAPATGIRFRACLLSLPPRALVEKLRAALPEQFPVSTSSRVEGLIDGHMRAGFAMNLDQVSEVLGTPQRTLRRHLADEGLRFRDTIERSRFRIARELLADPDLKIEAVAHHLGYSGSNNFVRAFRRMSGLTPGQFRHQKPDSA